MRTAGGPGDPRGLSASRRPEFSTINRLQIGMHGSLRVFEQEKTAPCGAVSWAGISRLTAVRTYAESERITVKTKRVTCRYQGRGSEVGQEHQILQVVVEAA